MLLPTCLLYSALFCSANAATRALAGTWTSKSKSVYTGPGFFNPLTDSLFEPKHTGVSYSFTADGFYEFASFTISSNPVSPGCSTGAMQWAHGSYTLPAKGGINMIPIAVDGRQLISQPCKADVSLYTRFSSNDTMQSYLIELDAYSGQWKLTLNRLYGSPVQPLYLAYDPPQMLPTTTLLPSAKARSKRSLGGTEGTQAPDTDSLTYAWYSAVGMILVGGIGYLCV